MVERTETGITIEQQMQFGEDEWIEIVNGVPMRTEDMAAAGFLHIISITNLFRILDVFARRYKLGHVFADGLTYNMRVDDTQLIIKSRIPDVSFIRRSNLKQFDYTLPYPGYPDLAVEVVSPNESAEDLQDKIADYRAAGTEQVWVVYASTKTVHVYERDNTVSVRVYQNDDSLEAPTLFPELKINVADLFVFPE